MDKTTSTFFVNNLCNIRLGNKFEPTKNMEDKISTKNYKIKINM